MCEKNHKAVACDLQS